MPKIQLLDQNTINKIAAGEVVERPAAVVKELIENAIDAGANAVTCEIKEGGISFIRITDNGCGIDKDDIDTAFLRHATSKIRTVEDLLSVSSLGFRGEALASIASVAQVELVTKTAKDMTGVRYVIEGGVKKSCEDIGCPNGTTFIVRNLFFNTPARRKFLKSATTEAGYINDLMMRLSVSHPDVSFKFIVNNQIKLHTSGNNNLKDILYSIYGREIASSLLEVQAETSDIKIHGFVGKPLISRGNRTYENFYINGRYIKSGIICKAIEEAYKPYMMQHKYPFTALHYEIDSDLIDVNVHPTKLEIRFRNGESIFRVTHEAVAEALSTKDMIPEVHLNEKKLEKVKIEEAPEPFEQRRLQKENSPFLMKRPDNSSRNLQSNDIKDVKYGNPYSNTSAEVKEEVKETEIGKLQDVVQHAYEYGQLRREDRGEVLAGEQDSSGDNPSQQPQDTLSIFEQLRRKREELLKNTRAETEIPEPSEVQDVNGVQGLGKVQEVDGVQGLDEVQGAGDVQGLDGAQGASEEQGFSRVQAASGVQDSSAIQDGTQIGTDSPIGMVKEEPVYAGGTQMNLFQAATTLTESGEEEISAPFLSTEARKHHRIIGQLFATYWIVEYDAKMFIIDQHAAHEKVLYEKTMKKVHDKVQMAQMIHPPIVISFSMREEEVYLKHQDVFERLGFEIENFGGQEYSIRAVPSDMLSIADATLFLDMIDQLVENNYERDSELVLEKVASMSCKAAIKGNQKISYQEASNLIDQLLELENPYHCPHGRPVIISMSKYEIEKKFKRII